MLLFVAACSSGEGDQGKQTVNTVPATPAINYAVTAVYPHDTGFYTQGLNFYGDKLWESTGQYGASRMMQVDLRSGKPRVSTPIDSTFFGEGHVILRDTVYMLTWKEKKMLLFDAGSLRMIKSTEFPTDGWGLTTNGQELIASDGSSNLYFYEPGTIRLLRTQGVTENGMPVSQLNELEFVNGHIYANIYQTNDIVKIDASNGQVVGRMNFDQLVQQAQLKNPNADVLNGIAFNPANKKFYITGKYWPELYELQLPF